LNWFLRLLKIAMAIYHHNGDIQSTLFSPKMTSFCFNANDSGSIAVMTWQQRMLVEAWANRTEMACSEAWFLLTLGAQCNARNQKLGLMRTIKEIGLVLGFVILFFTSQIAVAQAEDKQKADASREPLPMRDLEAALAPDSTSAQRDSAIGKTFEGWMVVNNVAAVNEWGITKTGGRHHGGTDNEKPGTFVIISRLPNTSFQLNLWTTDGVRAASLKLLDTVKVRGRFDKYETGVIRYTNPAYNTASAWAAMRNVEIIEIKKNDKSASAGR